MSAVKNQVPVGGVLVGGRSRRFGSDKATARICGRSLAAWAAQNLQEAADPVVLLGGDAELSRDLSLPWLPDVRPDAGPLAGVAAGLGWAREQGHSGLLVLACDLPLVTGPLLEAIAAASGEGVDAVIPTTATPLRVQPLCAWYGTSVLPHALACLPTGERSMRGLIARLNVRFLPCASRAEDGEPLFLNVNTPEQLALADSYLEARELRTSGP